MFVIKLLEDRRAFAAAAIGAMALSLAWPAQAAPLRMDYSLKTLAPGGSYQYEYDFEVVLANADNSWIPGEEWDGFVFGDRVSGDPTVFARFEGVVTNISEARAGGSTYTGGAHQGPTIIFGDYPSLPDGWKPTAVGQSFSWTYLSNTYVAPGELLWSTTAYDHRDNRAWFGIANHIDIDSAVPEPASWAMMVGGFGIICGALRNQRKAARRLA